ncbi:DUF1993 family protein [Aestuariibius insulae]|uniref:DUF1993 family protein n=1 Tax=Aestuariibius insulae TaxID=2058287 RepID=UPI00345E8228
MPSTFAEASIISVRHYLDRIGDILTCLSEEEDTDRLLAIRLAPDMFDTGFNFAVSIQFAARALCPPAGMDIPEIPEVYTCESLATFRIDVHKHIAPITASDLVHPVAHQADDAQLRQDVADYIARFALPNMIFHLSLAYGGLRHGGMTIGKADFDGLHRY